MTLTSLLFDEDNSKNSSGSPSLTAEAAETLFDLFCENNPSRVFRSVDTKPVDTKYTDKKAPITCPHEEEILAHWLGVMPALLV